MSLYRVEYCKIDSEEWDYDTWAAPLDDLAEAKQLALEKAADAWHQYHVRVVKLGYPILDFRGEPEFYPRHSVVFFKRYVNNR